MKTFILGSAKYKNPKTKQFESLPCLKGDKGEKGDKGDVGESSYQIAKRLGTFTGTEEEWNDYIKTEREKAIEDIRKAGEDLTNSLPADYVKMTEDVTSLKEEITELKRRIEVLES